MLKHLKTLRTEAGISQALLAEQIGVSQQSVNKYENHNVEPDIHTLMLIADYFGTTVDYLIGRTFTQTNDPQPQCQLTADELHLVCKYRSLTPHQKKAIQELLNSYKK